MKLVFKILKKTSFGVLYILKLRRKKSSLSNINISGLDNILGQYKKKIIYFLDVLFGNKNYDMSLHFVIKGGGLSSQFYIIQNLLIQFFSHVTKIKTLKFQHDLRIVERKKVGQPKARKHKKYHKR